MSSGNTPLIHPAIPLIFPSQETDSCHEKLDDDAAWRYFSHSIKRNPANLKLHTHRIFFAMQHKNSTYLAGSLHDLFCILKDSGENLRIRLLKASAPFLSESDINYYAKWLKTGFKSGMNYKWIKGSILSPGLNNTDQLLITAHVEDNGSVTLSPLEEARSCMEYGQLEVAQTILEKALLKDPDNIQIQEELKHVHSYTEETKVQIAQTISNNKNTLSNTFKKIKIRLFS